MAVAEQWALVSWQSPRRRRSGLVRYAGVLAVWLLLLVVNPPLAWDIFRNRRADSPIPRLGRCDGGPLSRRAGLRVRT